MEKKVIKFNLIGAIAILVLVVAVIVGLIIGIPKIIEGAKERSSQSQQQKRLAEIDENKEYYEKVVLETGEERECRMKYLKSTFGYAMKFDADLFFAEKNVLDKDNYYSLYSNLVGIMVEKKEGEFSKLAGEMDQEARKEIEQNKEKYTKCLNNNLNNGNGSMNNSVQQNTAKNNNTTQHSYTNGVTAGNTSKENTNSNVSTNSNSASEVMKKTELENQRNAKIGQVLVSTDKIDGHDMVKRVIVSNDNTEYTYCIKIDDNHYYSIFLYCSKSFEQELLPIMEHMVNSFIIY